MTRFDMNAFFLLTLGMLAGPHAAHAAESYDNCKGFITSLPTVISTPGTWCLNQDLATPAASGQAISITTDNVTIDCNGFKLGGLAAGVGTATVGIYAFNRSYTTVRHCNVRGFHHGVYLLGSGGVGNAVEDNRFDNNTYVGLWVDGDGSVVQRNRIFDTGGSTQGGSNYAYGLVTDDSVDILDNTISGVSATSGGNGYAFGIYTTSNANGSVVGNGIRGLVKDGSGNTVAIDNALSDRVVMRKNDLVGGTTALVCSNGNGRAKDNTISGFAAAFFGCNDSGGNAILP